VFDFKLEQNRRNTGDDYTIIRNHLLLIKSETYTMLTQFLRTQPVQACKLGAIIVVLLFATGGVFGVVPVPEVTGLFLIIVLSVGIAFVVVAERLYAGYRFIDTDTSLRKHLTNPSVVTFTRAIEAVGVALVTGRFILFIATYPDPAPTGGIIDILSIMVKLGVVVLGGSLIRTLSEYYCYRNADKV